jgi:hypothetical protein
LVIAPAGFGQQLELRLVWEFARNERMRSDAFVDVTKGAFLKAFLERSKRPYPISPHKLPLDSRTALWNL